VHLATIDDNNSILIKSANEERSNHIMWPRFSGTLAAWGFLIGGKLITIREILLPLRPKKSIHSKYVNLRNMYDLMSNVDRILYTTWRYVSVDVAVNNILRKLESIIPVHPPKKSMANG